MAGKDPAGRMSRLPRIQWFFTSIRSQSQVCLVLSTEGRSNCILGRVAHAGRRAAIAASDTCAYMANCHLIRAVEKGQAGVNETAVVDGQPLISPELHLLIACIGGQTAPVADVDWERFGRLAVTHGVAPLMGRTLSSTSETVPPGLLDGFKQLRRASALLRTF